MGADPIFGAIYVFRANRADRVKLVYFDGTGLCLLAKRLGDGKFCWPAITDGVVMLMPLRCRRCWKGVTGGVCMMPARRARQSRQVDSVVVENAGKARAAFTDRIWISASLFYRRVLTWQRPTSARHLAAGEVGIAAEALSLDRY
ncbi:IS66 family insertion sequence element accessory protein TnpB [Tianweitania sp. Rool2]|uniref:IS66 family insertion sequence element accessory protein TnpB n=2 Tax=Oryzicola mucosus TaxID=2767425 RepID=A0A8J6PYU6_9HYPH|nr:IS66 family insertion sequence element accessory protein TnpB [Oryzicola mucosus]MBD0416867.1 IS66 family insertion sequence element accessory protein TnpB [Oryzicola mucosus]